MSKYKGTECRGCKRIVDNTKEAMLMDLKKPGLLCLECVAKEDKV